MKTLIFATTLLLACNAVRAGDPKAGPAAPSATVTVTGTGAMTGAYSPTHKSVFGAAADAHNPFWPIGWAKTEEISMPDAVTPVTPHASDFTVTSILLNEPPIAVINGQEMAEGEVGAIPVNGQPVMVQLMAVQDGRVIIRWQNQNLIVPLHRDEDFSTDAAGQPTPVTAALQ